MTLEIATAKAIAQSMEFGCVQHVNSIGFNLYVVSDWFDGTTVASYENGKKL